MAAGKVGGGADRATVPARAWWQLLRAVVALLVVLGSLAVTVALIRAALLDPLAGFWLWLALVVGAAAGFYVGLGQGVRAGVEPSGSVDCDRASDGLPPCEVRFEARYAHLEAAIGRAEIDAMRSRLRRGIPGSNVVGRVPPLR